MSPVTQKPPPPIATRKARRQEGVWGHLLVGACACLLTVSIVGSALYLSYKVYDRHRWQEKARTFVSSLENRTPSELAADVEQLKTHPAVARYILPALLENLREHCPERDRIAAIEVSKAFLDKERIRRALLRLRDDPNESVASLAVEALGEVQPAERAAGMLAQCLGPEPGTSSTVMDAACVGLVRLGEPGKLAMAGRIGELSGERRAWLAGYVEKKGVTDKASWLEMLGEDADAGEGPSLGPSTMIGHGRTGP